MNPSLLMSQLSKLGHHLRQSSLVVSRWYTDMGRAVQTGEVVT
jgi:hypothetical protein